MDKHLIEKHKYAADYRDYKQYRRNVERDVKVEVDVLKRVIYDCEQNGIQLLVEGYGMDKQPEYYFDGDFNDKADYKINGKLVEIKFRRYKDGFFTLKKDNVDSYLTQKACLLLVYGYDTPQPVYTLISPLQLWMAVKDLPAKLDVGWNKLVYRVGITTFDWKPLPSIPVEKGVLN